MTLTKKIVIGISAFILVLLLANVALNYWLQRKLPKIIHEKNTTVYEIGFKNLNMSLWSSTITADTVLVKPKIKPKNSSQKIGIYSQIAGITIRDYSIWDLLFHNTLSAQSITITEPNVLLYYQKQKDKNNYDRIKNDVVAPFKQIIKVKDIYIQKGSVSILRTKTNKVFVDVKNINLSLDGITIDEQTLKEKIPFKFSNYKLTVDSILYQPNIVYKIRTKQLTLQNHEFKASDFELVPLLHRKEFVKNTKKEKDLFIIKAKNIAISDMDWGFNKKQLFFNAKKILLDQVDANIYRNKIPADDLSKKKLYSEILRNLKFAMTIDSVEMRNSKLVYEEEINFEKGAAVLTFDRFHLKATNVQSGLGLQKTKDLKIKINCVFMKNSDLNVDWKFNILDPNDSFNIKGTIINFDVNAMKRFTRPYVNASFDGKFKKYHFDIWGNDIRSKGNASLEYSDLDVTLYKKKEPKKEAKLKSALVNLILKKDSNDESKTCTMEVERAQEKSFYNFLWLNVAESLKKILI